MPRRVAASDEKIEESELHQVTNLCALSLCALSPIFHTLGGDRA